MTELYEILRPVSGDRLYLPGEIVDGGGWRNAHLLEAQGRMRRHIPAAEPKPRIGKKGVHDEAA